MNAIGRNRGIRDLVARQEGRVTAGTVNTFWESIMTSPRIASVDASGISGSWTDRWDAVQQQPPETAFTDEERRECAELVAELIRTNPRITTLEYHPWAHDVHIMESRVVPIVLLNRLRSVLSAPPDASAGVVSRERFASALLGSPHVRNHPQILFFLLQATRGHSSP